MNTYMKACLSVLCIFTLTLSACTGESELARSTQVGIHESDLPAQNSSSSSLSIAATPAAANQGSITGVLSTSEYVINGQAITESSGLARSNLNPDLLWTHNDSGSGTVVHGLTLEGSHIATVSLNGLAVINLDWEDMTSFIHQNKSYLLVADVGDNNAVRPVTTLYLIEEPAIDPKALGVQNLTANVVGIYVVSFPDLTPRDVEAVGVDTGTAAVYLITKRESKPTLYSFSLGELGTSSVAAMEPLRVPVILNNEGPINIPRATGANLENPEAFNWVTSMDIDETGSRAVVTTLMHGYIYQRAPQQTWKKAFEQKPLQFPLPKYSQIEASTWIKGRDSIMITSENVPAKMARFDMNIR